MSTPLNSADLAKAIEDSHDAGQAIGSLFNNLELSGVSEKAIAVAAISNGFRIMLRSASLDMAIALALKIMHMTFAMESMPNKEH